MTAQRRRNLLDARRRPDEAEDEDSVILGQGDDSQSEGSILTAADDPADDSDLSQATNVKADGVEESQGNLRSSSRIAKNKRSKQGRKTKTNIERNPHPAAADSFKSAALAETTGSATQVNERTGARVTNENEQAREHNSEYHQADKNTGGGTRRPPITKHTNSRDQDLRRDGIAHGLSIPGKGGRTFQGHHSESNNNNGLAKGRGRGRGVIPTGPAQVSDHEQRRVPKGEPADQDHRSSASIQALPEANGGRWDHDLHDTVANVTHVEPVSDSLPRSHLGASPAARSSNAPSMLSRSVNIGTVTARVYLPNMKGPINFERMPVKQHTRLPDLRPPLRRDKPVRVSIPEQSPRYIFPSIERSFIFIPRAQRPNQQQGGKFRRGGGYFSASGSRRPSIYGGSNYTPSVAMSRRSSIAARDSMISPTGSVRPVVKLPFGAQPFQPVNGFLGATPGLPPVPPYALPSQPAFRGAANAIPMHQPRPQKAISVTTIEAPQMDAFAAPHQQEQQPFHHQVPQHMNGQGGVHGRNMSMQSQASANTPLSNIPEQAVNAQPFQPMYAAVPGPASNASATSYGYPGMYMYSMPEMQATGGGYLVPVVQGPSAVSGGAMYEQGGTTFYYADPNSQMGVDAQYGGGAAPAEGYYYAQPPMMYYPTA